VYAFWQPLISFGASLTLFPNWKCLKHFLGSDANCLSDYLQLTWQFTDERKHGKCGREFAHHGAVVNFCKNGKNGESQLCPGSPRPGAHACPAEPGEHEQAGAGGHRVARLLLRPRRRQDHLAVRPVPLLQQVQVHGEGAHRDSPLRLHAPVSPLREDLQD